MTSNQVMEHVMHQDVVFREIHRCLSPGGLSINLFPAREVLWEGHALMPLVHRIKDEQRRARLMLFFAKVGFRRHYYREMPRRGWKRILTILLSSSYAKQLGVLLLKSRLLTPRTILSLNSFRTWDTDHTCIVLWD